MPFKKMQDWLAKEKALGVEDPDYAILATVSPKAIPHSRVVAIREIEAESLLFFSQQKTRKVSDLLHNPHASLTFFFALQKRQILLEGKALPLSKEENEFFWQGLPRERQLRFHTYAATLGQVIQDLSLLENRQKELEQAFANQPIPLCETYRGFRFWPERFLFYSLSANRFSEAIRYRKEGQSWQEELLSP